MKDLKGERKLRVLIVDDTPKNIQVLGSMLRDKGFEVSFSMNGNDALKKLKKKDYDLILLDVMMPGINGFETCRRIKADPDLADVPVIFLTARTDDESKMEGFESGGVDYVEKPFKNYELMARVDSHLNLKRARDDIKFQKKQLEQENIFRKALQMKLERTNEKLKEAEQIKNEFISILSHDMGTPITVIKGNLELIEQMNWDKLPEPVQNLIRNMEKASNILDHLRNNTLDLSRMDVGTMELDLNELDLEVLIREAVSDIVTITNSKNQNIHIDLPEKMPAINGDMFKLKRVITNYLSNASRYSDEGKDIFITAKVYDKEVEVKVMDNGRGLMKEELERVFERFYRTGKRVEGSTGLGLAIVKGIIKGHGGRAWAESEGEGKGSTFIFTLPISDP
ncbi:MAG: hybrid sensor histidine kinase/response regulator [Candidatus Thermoplasmatota archaeon]|nr:hybrid sensor histidine kinase/response regulator [Candidatus Thermoplasmatota archaeon]